MRGGETKSGLARALFVGAGYGLLAFCALSVTQRSARLATIFEANWWMACRADAGRPNR